MIRNTLTRVEEYFLCTIKRVFARENVNPFLNIFVMKNNGCWQALRQELEKKGWASQDTI